MRFRNRHDLARVAALLLALISFVLIVYAPAPDDLAPQGQMCIAIFVVAVILWVSQALPLMITSLLVVVLFPLTGVLSAVDSYALFGNQAIFFILGAFILASGVMRSGLSTRLALIVFQHCGRSPVFLVMSILCLSAFFSFWMSEHAVAAMMFPIVLELIESLQLKPEQSNYGKCLILSMTWGCIIGGVTTFLGGARAPLALGILRQSKDLSIDFMHWALAALPTVILLILAAYIVIIRMFPPEVSDISNAQKVLKRKSTRMGRVTRREQMMGALMLATIVAWIIYGERLGLANIAIVAVVFAFLFRLLDWKEVEQDVNWGIFLMYGGAICLGYVMAKPWLDGDVSSSAAHWLAAESLGLFVNSRWGLIFSLVLISLFLTEAISNTAVVALLLPLAIGLGSDYNLDPRLITLALTIPCGLAFQLPMGTPATAIAFSSGFVALKDTLLGGMILKIFAFILLVLSITFYWPLIGF